jgi:hypothetical protein
VKILEEEMEDASGISAREGGDGAGDGYRDGDGGGANDGPARSLPAAPKRDSSDNNGGPAHA